MILICLGSWNENSILKHDLRRKLRITSLSILSLYHIDNVDNANQKGVKGVNILPVSIGLAVSKFRVLLPEEGCLLFPKGAY